MVGGDVQGAGSGSGQRLQTDALTVQRNGNTGGTAGAVDLPDFGIAGILQSENRVPAQQLRQQQVQVFRTGADDDLLRRNGHAPEVPEVGGNGLPQCGQPLMGHRGQQSLRLLRQHLTGEPGPGGDGEPGGVHLIAAEIQPPPGRALLRQGGGFPENGRNLLHGGHEKSPLWLRLKIALRFQLAVGALHGDDGDVKMLRQRPLGGQSGPGGEYAPQNI